MGKKIKYFVFLIFVSIVAMGILWLNTFSKTIEDEYLNNETEFNEFVTNFINQDKINNISLDGKKRCSIINSWGICPRFESRWSKQTDIRKDGIPEEIYLDTREEVLKAEEIDIDQYNFVIHFLDTYDITGTGKGIDRQDVELTKGLTGLRYYVSADNEFVEDNEYMHVKKINDNWYFYIRDRN